MFRGLNADPSGIYLNLNNGVWYIDMLRCPRILLLCTVQTDTLLVQVFWACKYITRTVFTRNLGYGGEVLVVTAYGLYSLIPFRSH